MPAETGTQTSFNKMSNAVWPERTATANVLPVVVDPGLRRDDGVEAAGG